MLPQQYIAKARQRGIASICEGAAPLAGVNQSLCTISSLMACRQVLLTQSDLC